MYTEGRKTTTLCKKACSNFMQLEMNIVLLCRFNIVCNTCTMCILAFSAPLLNYKFVSTRPFELKTFFHSSQTLNIF